MEVRQCQVKAAEQGAGFPGEIAGLDALQADPRHVSHQAPDVAVLLQPQFSARRPDQPRGLQAPVGQMRRDDLDVPIDPPGEDFVQSLQDEPVTVLAGDEECLIDQAGAQRLDGPRIDVESGPDN